MVLSEAERGTLVSKVEKLTHPANIFAGCKAEKWVGVGVTPQLRSRTTVNSAGFRCESGNLAAGCVARLGGHQCGSFY